jgi:aromatase
MAEIDNSVVIDRPLDEVWRRMNELENWTNLFTEYASVEILEREGDTVRFRLTMHPDESGHVWSWVSERTMYPDEHRTHSHRIETGPFDHMNIDWYFEDADGGTKMRWVQEFSVKREAPMNDEQATNYLNENTAIQMQAIKERLES